MSTIMLKENASSLIFTKSISLTNVSSMINVIFYVNASSNFVEIKYNMSVIYL
jgi:hypothetical protein